MNLSRSMAIFSGCAMLLGGAGCVSEPVTSSVRPGTWGQENRATTPSARRTPSSPNRPAPTTSVTPTSTNEVPRKVLRAGNGDRAASQLKPGVPSASTNAVDGPLVRLGSDIRGQIQTVNQGARYVVLRFPLGVMPAKNSFLDVVRGGVKVGEIRVTGPQKDNLTVGDILVGGFEVGDEVRAQAVP